MRMSRPKPWRKTTGSPLPSDSKWSSPPATGNRPDPTSATDHSFAKMLSAEPLQGGLGFRERRQHDKPFAPLSVFAARGVADDARAVVVAGLQRQGGEPADDSL